MTRQKKVAVTFFVMVWAVALGVFFLLRLHIRHHHTAPARVAPRTYHYEDYPTRGLAGMQFRDLFSDYTGIRGRAPKVARLSFCKNFQDMWNRKLARAGRNPVVIGMADQIVGEYCADPNKLTLDDYTDVVDGIVRRTRKDLDWEEVARIEHLDPKQVKLVHAITYSLDGRDFVAYSMTELFPGKDGKFNRKVLEFMLRNGGREYVEGIPAMFDAYTSFGPYQFTDLAWYDAGGVRRGGSRLNVALHDRVPHGSVARLRGDEHHIAAFLFAVDNISCLVRHSDGKQLGTLEKAYRPRHREIVQFIATAHNYPAGAMSAAHRWLANGARKPYMISCSWKPRGYAAKTAANMDAIHN